jgi:hypothetical protein
MTYLKNRDFYYDIATSVIPGYRVIQKFGRLDNVTTTLKPICIGGNYQTPTSDKRLYVYSDNTLDRSGSTGALSIHLIGLNSVGAEVTAIVSTNGTVTVDSGQDFLRLYRFGVRESGTYATQDSGSHAGTLVVVDASANEWGRIDIADGVARGQSQIGAFTVPAGKKGRLMEIKGEVNSNKPVDIYLFKREEILQTTAPFSPLRLISEFDGASGEITLNPRAPLDVFPSLTDFGFMAKVSTGSAIVAVDFEIILEDE